MTWVNPQSVVILQLGAAAAQPSPILLVTEPLTLSATTLAPTKPAVCAYDAITITDDGSGWVNCDLVYSAVSVASSGSGVYLIKLPGGYKFDTLHNVNVQSSIIAGVFPSTDDGKILHGSGTIKDAAGAFENSAAAVPHSSTHFKVLARAPIQPLAAPVLSGTFWSSGYWGIVAAVRLNFRFKKG